MSEEEYDNEEYAFSTHDDVVRVVRLMEENISSNMPKILWVSQREQLRSAVRNHLESLGYSSFDEDVIRGALYGAVLAINLESQSSVVSLQTVMLTTVLLDMVENPMDIDMEQLDDLRDFVNSATKRQQPHWAKVLTHKIIDALTR